MGRAAKQTGRLCDAARRDRLRRGLVDLPSGYDPDQWGRLHTDRGSLPIDRLMER